MHLPADTRNVIFDLGEVIIDLDIPGTIARFSGRTGKTPEEVRSIYSSSGVFLDYEKGLISDAEFRSGANRLFGSDIGDDEFDSIWNSMLLRLPAERLDLLERVAGKYRTFLLSNTNAIHLKAFTEMVGKLVAPRRLEEYFEKAYYSHEIRMRKPDAEIFNFVLKEKGLDPAQTVFLDDNADNIKGASGLGIQAIQVTRPDILFQLFE